MIRLWMHHIRPRARIVIGAWICICIREQKADFVSDADADPRQNSPLTATDTKVIDEDIILTRLFWKATIMLLVLSDRRLLHISTLCKEFSLSLVIEGSLHISTLGKEFNNSCIKSAPPNRQVKAPLSFCCHQIEDTYRTTWWMWNCDIWKVIAKSKCPVFVVLRNDSIVEFLGFKPG